MFVFGTTRTYCYPNEYYWVRIGFGIFTSRRRRSRIVVGTPTSKMEGVDVAVDAEPNWIKYSKPRHVTQMGIKASPVLW